MRKSGNTRGPLWTGPPNLTARAKKNLRESERRTRLSKNKDWADAERKRLWEKDLRETEARSKAKRTPNYDDAGISIVNVHSLKRPPLRYVDAHGRVHTERECSAEELIARWQTSQLKDKTAPALHEEREQKRARWKDANK